MNFASSSVFSDSDVMDSSELGILGEALLGVARKVGAIPASELPGPEFVRLSRKVYLLCHLFEEIGDFALRLDSSSSSSSTSLSTSSSSSSSLSLPYLCLKDLLLALENVQRFLLLAAAAASSNDKFSKNISLQFQYVTWQLQSSLEKVGYDHFDISDEVREQVDLVSLQLKRAIEKSGPASVEVFSEVHSILSIMDDTQTTVNPPNVKDVEDLMNALDKINDLEPGVVNHVDSSILEMVSLLAEVNGKTGCDVGKIASKLLQNPIKFKLADSSDAQKDATKSDDLPEKKMEETKKLDPLQIPDDFRCPISLELMKDPVIVSTGQTYERSSIQRWIDGGSRTCPKTQQKLHNLTLTPNYILRSLIMQWCEVNKFEHGNVSSNGRIRKSDGTYIEVSGDRGPIDELISKLASGPIEVQRSSAGELRSLAKRSTDNRILIAEAGAIPILVNLLLVEDEKTQEHAVTALLNLSIYDNNKGLIMMAGAITPIVQVLRSGSMEAKENAAAAIFSLSLIDENKIVIGSTPGAIDELVELLRSGSSRGRKDAATALFNLCIYQGNKARAIRAGILSPLLKMLTEFSSSCMVDEALTILSVLVSHHEGKVAITKANLIPVLIDLLRAVQPRSKENAAAILLALCKKNNENLACIGRLGALIPLTELSKSGTDRAKRKANSLLDHMNRSQMMY